MTADPVRRPTATASRRKPSAKVATKAARPATTPAPAAAPVAPVAETGTWLLQADAAARTGFSVSAIRKWRRAGLVADRMRTTAGGSERVEVRLEDVEARRAEQPPERTQTTPSPPEAGPSPGTAIIPLNDLEALFGRVREAEGRCRDAEARQQAAEVETRYLSGQLAELRQQLQAATAEAVAARAAVEDRRSRVTVMTAARVAAPTTGGGPGPTDSPRNAFDRATLDRVTADLLGLDPNRERRPATPPPAPTTTRTSRPTPIRPTERPAAGPAPAATPGRRPTAPAAPASRTGPAAERAVPRPPPPGSGRQGQDRVTAGPPGRESAPGPNGASRDVTVESLASELRRLYGRLDGYRREPTISRARERQREQDLADYDAVLLQACAALAVPTGLRSGEKVSIERRAALTRSLARLGIDVRADPAPATRRR